MELPDLLAQRVTFLPEPLAFRLRGLHRRLELVSLIQTLANTPDDRRTVFEPPQHPHRRWPRHLTCHGSRSLTVRGRLLLVGRGAAGSSAPVAQEAEDPGAPAQRCGVRTPRPCARRGDQREVLRTKLVGEGGGAPPVPAPALRRHGLAGPPPLPLPPVAEDEDLVGLPVRALDDPVQLPLVPRHDQQGPRRLRRWNPTPSRQHRHSGARQGDPLEGRSHECKANYRGRFRVSRAPRTMCARAPRCRGLPSR